MAYSTNRKNGKLHPVRRVAYTRAGRARSPSAPPPNATTGRARSPSAPQSPIPARLRRLANLLKQGLITEEEHAAQRTRILNEL